jgi:general stress protein YciG
VNTVSGTKEGGVKAAETNKKRDPLHYQKIGRAGGIKHVPKGFSMAEPEVRKEMGQLGGDAYAEMLREKKLK